MNRVAIVAAKRSAIGKFGGSLKDISPAILGAEIVKSALKDIDINANLVDEVIFGNVLHAGLGQNISRQIAILSGIPNKTSAFVVNKVCGSGLKSVTLGAQSIMVGDNDIVVCGGIEIMSQAPHIVKNARFGAKLGSLEMQDLLIHDGLTDDFENYHMGITAENIVEQFNLSRDELDNFAFNSQQKAVGAIKNNKFKNEIVPVTIKNKKNTIIFDTDESPRANLELTDLNKLTPAFKKDGAISAGNSSSINDGAAVVILMSEKKAKELDIKPLAFIEGYASSGLDHKVMGLGPISATKKLLEKLNMSVEDIDLFELNEAFASQSIAVINELNINSEKVNVNGGAIALGHPIGASGTRILVTLVHELIKRDEKYGLCSLCIGGGQGISMLISKN